MKKMHYFLLAVVASLWLFQTHAQTADNIISKYIDNTGGKEKLSSVSSLTVDYTLNIMGTDAPSTLVLLVGKGLKNESDFGGQKVIQVVTDKGGWMVNPLAGINEPQSMEEQQYRESKDQLDYIPFLDYSSKGGRVELAGKEKLDDEDVYKIIFTDKDSTSTTCYFDAATFYLVKTIKTYHVMGQETIVSSMYSDFRKTDFGVVVPFISKVDYGQFQMTSTVNKIVFNTQVEPAVFEMKK